jgi:uncharacterized membrane protein (DUF373 family)
MNKQLNTILFVLGATLFNVLTTLLFIFLLLVLYSLISPYLPVDVQSWIFVVIFIGAIALSFVVYRIVIRILMKKIDVDKYFTQLFRGKR